ncbi:NAD-dependent epimerase/dehydratase family protein [Acetanaerobacterium elongatum]|uniref:UDP-glucose 4-epimerase n=1 Tax=Acetanaerobacterium elongatum TaxID=258515 RepID=A0A1G9XWY0_9FIRM|nr:NAD-dependent epimerase/dehydratase family protein [Acetanaerobacterium elongatum]SDN01287.1 UDP-glucose 4-epimerase [Acetanaerobacterium elongatum]
MKRIVITGASGYISTHLAAWLGQFKQEYEVTMLSLRGDTWQQQSFAGYDAVVHLAGLAHSKETEQNRALYTEVNRDLTLRVANKAKAEGAGRFVFVSTFNVYEPKAEYIEQNTPLAPVTAYGRSKLEAEEGLRFLADEGFEVVIVRPPMVYGPDCPGNFARLKSLALRCPVFPSLENARSMIYIENLCEFLRLCLTVPLGALHTAVYCPQNAEYVSTREIYIQLRRAAGKKACVIGCFNPLVRLLARHNGTFEKVFGNKTCNFALSAPEMEYNRYGFEESIKGCIRKN